MVNIRKFGMRNELFKAELFITESLGMIHLVDHRMSFQEQLSKTEDLKNLNPIQTEFPFRERDKSKSLFNSLTTLLWFQFPSH